MRQFLRILKYSWPYRYRLLASVFCALMVAALWSLNLSAIYPVLKILSTNQNLRQWVDGEIDALQAQKDDPGRLATAAGLVIEVTVRNAAGAIIAGPLTKTFTAHETQTFQLADILP